VRFEVLTAVKIQVGVSWVMTPCSDVISEDLAASFTLKM
jgi:hypothetical protein